jgi:tetratricopeptide (TPR) repeat protein
MLAVAVFLFGYSLTPQGRGRRALFSTVATAFALSGVAWAVYHGLRASGRPPASAAVAFASGQVALHEGDYELAIKQFRRATDLWPETVSAYVGLSAAEFAKNERDTTGILTLPRVASVRHAVADERKAIDNGSESPSVRSALAGNLLFLGLFTHDRASVREAGVLAREATQRFEEQLLEGRHPGSLLIAARYTIAEADFALGDPSYRGEYCAAIAQMVKLKDEVDPLVIANASWTDLGAIFTDHGSLLAAAKAIQQQVDAAAKTGRPTCSGILSG